MLLIATTQVYENRRDFLETIDEGAVRAGLASFLDVDIASKSRDGVSMQSDKVKRYTLKNPEKTFNDLMENNEYARDVQELLKDTSFGRAYLVVGSLTTTGTIWTYSQSRGHSSGFRVAVPVSQMMTIPGFIDPQISPKFSTTRRQERHMYVVEEEIFAFAYDEVKTSYSLDRSAKKIRGNPRHRRTVWAHSQQLAFGTDSDSSNDEVGGDKLGSAEVANVELVKSSVGSEDEFARSNYFDCETED
jgi:hypothetical protein